MKHFNEWGCVIIKYDTASKPLPNELYRYLSDSVDGGMSEFSLFM